MSRSERDPRGACSQRSNVQTFTPSTFKRFLDLSPFFSFSCALFCTIKKLNPFSFQSIPNSLSRNTGGWRCYSRALRPCRRRTPFCYHPASHPRRRHELYSASRRNPHRLRASLLGRQHHGNLRAPLLLRRVRFPRQLSPRKAEFPDRADRHARRHLWRDGLVSRDFRWRDRRPPRLSPCSLASLLDSCHFLLFARLHRCAVAGSSQSRCSPRDFRRSEERRVGKEWRAAWSV